MTRWRHEDANLGFAAVERGATLNSGGSTLGSSSGHVSLGTYCLLQLQQLGCNVMSVLLSQHQLGVGRQTQHLCSGEKGQRAVQKGAQKALPGFLMSGMFWIQFMNPS